VQWPLSIYVYSIIHCTKTIKNNLKSSLSFIVKNLLDFWYKCKVTHSKLNIFQLLNYRKKSSDISDIWIIAKQYQMLGEGFFSIMGLNQKKMCVGKNCPFFYKVLSMVKTASLKTKIIAEGLDKEHLCRQWGWSSKRKL